jgi:hypothetical protein
MPRPVPFTLAVLVPALLSAACGPPSPPPGCKPPPPTKEEARFRITVPGFEQAEIERATVAIGAQISTSARTGAPPSPTFVAAKQAYEARRWVDAAVGFRSAALANGSDDRSVREEAHYLFALSLLQLELTTDAHTVLLQIARDEDHRFQAQAKEKLRTVFCESR